MKYNCFEVKYLDVIQNWHLQLLCGHDNAFLAIAACQHELERLDCMHWFKFYRTKAALKRLFPKSSLNPNDNVKITQGKVFYSKRHKDFKRPKSNDKFKQVNKSNPVEKNGKNSGFFILDSKLHWTNKYPHKMIKMLIFSKTVMTILQTMICLRRWVVYWLQKSYRSPKYL